MRTAVQQHEISKQVVAMLGEGCDNKEMAHRLGIGDRDVARVLQQLRSSYDVPTTRRLIVAIVKGVRRPVLRRLV